MIMMRKLLLQYLSFHPSSDNDEKTVAAVDKPDDDSGENSRGCVSGIPDPRRLIAPIIVCVSCPKEVEDTRKDMPIIMKEQEKMEAINRSIIVFICGETGCGKTTQVPSSSKKRAMVRQNAT